MLRAVARFVLLAGGCPAQSRKTWGQWVLWVLWEALSKMRAMTVQNGFGVVPSVSDGKAAISRNSQSSQNSRITKTAERSMLSKMREMIVQNGFGVVPSVSDGAVQNRVVARFVLLAAGAGGCPAQSRKTWGLWGQWVLWGQWRALSPANAGREMIVQNEESGETVLLNDTPKYRSVWLPGMGLLYRPCRTAISHNSQSSQNSQITKIVERSMLSRMVLL